MAAMPDTSDVTSGSSYALFTQDPNGDNTIVARSNFPSPGVQDSLFGVLADPVMSQSGSYAFWGRMKSGLGAVTSGTSAGIWADTGSGLDLIARQGGTAVPGVPGTVKFTVFSRLVLPTGSGPIFAASISGQGISRANNNGVWAADGDGATELLLRKGDNIIIDGIQRKVSRITIFRTASKLQGQSRQFNQAGTVVCQVNCTDGMRAVLRLEQP
jgi:hypothetical protein